MFLVLRLTRDRSNKRNLLRAEPIGTAFALSGSYLFTAAHNVCSGKGKAVSLLKEIGVVRSYTDPIVRADIIILKHVAHCLAYDEDWAIYKRTTGTFSHFAELCPETELPPKGVKIGIKNYPVGLLAVGSATKVTLESFLTKIAHYEEFIDSVSPVPKRMKFAVTDTPQVVVERAVQVVGGRIRGSCGAAYFSSNGKVFAFHKESVDDGDEVSVSNSYLHF